MTIHEGDIVQHNSGGAHLTVTRVEGQPPDAVKLWVTSPVTGDTEWWVEESRVHRVRKRGK